jgi:hypothetical protein
MRGELAAQEPACPRLGAAAAQEPVSLAQPATVQEPVSLAQPATVQEPVSLAQPATVQGTGW